MITQVDSADCLKALSGIIDGLGESVTEGIKILGEIGEKSAKNTRWFKNQTGKLRENTKFHVDGLESGALVANTGYAGYVEFGNRPGGLGKYIYPKRAQALKFVIDGKVIFAKRVRAHGPLPFMKDASAEMIHYGRPVFEDVLSKLVSRYQK